MIMQGVDLLGKCSGRRAERISICARGFRLLLSGTRLALASKRRPRLCTWVDVVLNGDFAGLRCGRVDRRRY